MILSRSIRRKIAEVREIVAFGIQLNGNSLFLIEIYTQQTITFSLS